MLIFRRLLQIIFALLFVLILGIFLTQARPDYSILSFLVFIILIILVLGPWWPSEENMSKWKLNLRTDQPKLAALLLSIIFVCVCFYFAWDAYMQPQQKFHRLILKSIAESFGPEGVVAFWMVGGIICMVGLAKAFKELKI
jgi:hypothetical protein